MITTKELYIIKKALDTQGQNEDDDALFIRIIENLALQTEMDLNKI